MDSAPTASDETPTVGIDPATMPSPPDLYAAIDLGTNNCRMLIARPCATGIRVIESFSRIVRLGEGLTQTRRLSEAAMERTIEALAVCADRIARRPDIRRLRCVATEACRRAENGPEFVARARARTGLALEPIAAREEAALALHGCVPLLDRHHPRALVFDIGGGSTELLWADVPRRGEPRIIDAISLPYGVVTLSENYSRDPVPLADYRQMISRVEGGLLRFDRDHGISEAVARGRVQMLGTSGTVTTLGAVHLKLNRYRRSRVDGLTIDFDSLDAARECLCRMTCRERSAIPCIGESRADLVVAGCAILDAMCRRWPVGRLRIADRGLREGMLLGLMEADGHRCDRHPRRASRHGRADRPRVEPATAGA